MNNQPTNWKVQQVNVLRAQARRWRIGTTVVTFGITAFCLAVLYSSATKLARPGVERDQFASHFKEGLTTQVMPQAQQIARRTWHELVPAVQTEVVKLQGRYPELADGVEHELERLSVNLPIRAEKALRDTVGQMIAQRTETIQQLYGDITPAQVERIRTVLQSEGERRAGNLAETLVQPFEGTVQKIHEDLAAIEASFPDDKTTVESTEQLTTLLVRLTEDRLSTTALQLNRAVQEQKKLAEAK